MAQQGPRLPIGPPRVTTTEGRGLGAVEAAALWRGATHEIGVARVARVIGISEPTVYKQGELQADTLPGEAPDTVRTNPLRAVSLVLSLAVETGHEDRAIAIVRALAELIGYRAVPASIGASEDPMQDGLEATAHLSSALRAIYAAHSPDSPGGTQLTVAEALAIEPSLAAAAMEIAGVLELCAQAKAEAAPRFATIGGSKR